METINKLIRDKNVLFISTKNKDYIRNQQEIVWLKSRAASCEEIVFCDHSYIRRLIKVWAACCKREWKRADVIFVGFAPQLLWPFLKKWTRQKTVIIDFFISLYDTCVDDRKYFKDRSVMAKLLHKIDEATLTWCHFAIADTKADRRYFSEEFHIPADKIRVMYLKADTRIYDPQKYPLSGHKDVMSVLYFGSILPLQGIDVILEAVRSLQDHKDILFTIIGPVRTEKNGKRTTSQAYRNAVFYGWLSQEELARKIAQADLCLAGHFHADIGKAKRTIPGKAYIYEAMDKPMILGDNEANRELFREDERHFFVEMGNAQALADQITAFGEKWNMQREDHVQRAAQEWSEK